MRSRKGRVRRTLLSLLLVLPLIVGAAYLGWAGIGPSAAWTADGDGEARSAPGPVPGIDVAQVQEARRALGDANTRAGFLDMGMGQAEDGIGELREGGTALVDGTGQIRSGASDLASGMTQLQAGTAELGNGARDLAAGATAISENVGMVAVAAGQVGAALGPALDSLRASNDPAAQEAVMDLESLQRQLGMIDFDGIAGEASTMAAGANELSNQLNSPGAAYRDGVYTATQGAAELRDATAELDDGARELDAGLLELEQGSGRLSDQVDDTTGAIREAQRAMPVPTEDQLAAAGLTADAGGEGAAPNATLAPTLAFVVSALVMLGASALWLIGRPGHWSDPDRSARFRWLPGAPMLGALAGIVAVGAVVLFIMADGMDLLRGVTSVLVLGLAALAATALARAVLVVFGGTWGRVALLLGMVLQVGVIGWVWRTAAGSATGEMELATAWGVIAALLPLHHPTAALSALGNDGSTMLWGVSAGVLLALVVIGALIERFGGGRRAAVATAPPSASTASPATVPATSTASIATGPATSTASTTTGPATSATAGSSAPTSATAGSSASTSSTSTTAEPADSADSAVADDPETEVIPVAEGTSSESTMENNDPAGEASGGAPGDAAYADDAADDAADAAGDDAAADIADDIPPSDGPNATR